MNFFFLTFFSLPTNVPMWQVLDILSVSADMYTMYMWQLKDAYASFGISALTFVDKTLSLEHTGPVQACTGIANKQTDNTFCKGRPL